MSRAARVGWAGILTVAACAASCGPLRPCFADCHGPLAATFRADPLVAPVALRVVPAAAWTDTRVAVHKGDRLLFTATGEVFWFARHRSTGPDGEDGAPGWRVGSGGLRGRVGADGQAFDVGARTGAFPDGHARGPHHPYPPPPIEMRRDGMLQLGFKDFVAGPNSGAFDVTVQRAVGLRP